ncbi:MAG: DUF5074 domain-containing protein [Muribaculaceae bacterium]|nr:DUF5074 domain-containing protein [Muribaculaceae bacterium]
MKRALIASFAILAAMAPAIAAQEADYTEGIVWVNEDWYGHQNSTVNYLLPDDPDGNYWKYRIIQAENPGKELGCTNQYGAIWHDRLYLIAKQDKDPGATITGGRITVADAKTMKILHQQSLIDPSGAQCDGRGFLGVDEHKGYISTSNGVWIFDLDTYTVTGQVEGSANPNAGGDNDKPNTDPTGSLYHGQSGMMVSAAGKVFVAHQQYGLLVVDPTKDEVVNVISMDIVQEGAGIGSIVKSKDGFLWLSVAKNLQGTGAFLNHLVRLDPATLAYEIIDIPEGMYPPSNSWYAWTPDAFVASTVQNCLYWKGGPNRWFTGTKIYKFDCDTREQSLFIDLEEEGANWKLYGCAIGVHPVTDDIYMALYHEFGTPTYITRRYSAHGEKIRDYEMIMNYWFPSLPLFPQSGKLSGIDDISADATCTTGNLYTINGMLVKESVDYGAWRGISPGIYIWRSFNTARKVLIK